MNEPILKIAGVSKLYDGFQAVDNATFNVQRGEIFGLLGGSGCGKTTLLRMVAGFVTPTYGSIQLEDENLIVIPPYKRKVNMMFQSYALFPHLSVEKNIAFGLKQDKLPKQEIAQRTEEMLSLVEMEQYAKRKPHQLSGGQRQRVALARSLSKKPKVLLLDEPMGALDKKLRTQMQLEVVNIIEEVGVTCIIVTHDQEEAMTMCSRIAVMDKGRIIQIDSPSNLYEFPHNRTVSEFFGQVNIFNGKLAVDEKNHSEIKSPQLKNSLYIPYSVSGTLGKDIEIAIRPEKVNISKKQPKQTNNVEKGKIIEIAYLGSNSVYHVILDSGFRFLVFAANSSKSQSVLLTWEDEVYVYWEGENCIVLNQ